MTGVITAEDMGIEDILGFSLQGKYQMHKLQAA